MSEARTLRVKVPLQSPPPWLAAGIGGLVAGTAGAFMAAFAWMSASPWLGLLPGMTVAVFGASGLSVWSRRRGGTLDLEATPQRLDLSDTNGRQELLDLGAPYAAVLLVGRDRRALVVSQRGGPVAIFDPGSAASPRDAWEARSVKADLDAVPLSPSSAQVHALALGASLDPLLAHLGASLDADAPWMIIPTDGGAMITVTSREVSWGTRAKLTGGLVVTRYAAQSQGASVAALGLASTADEGVQLMVASEDAALAGDAVATEATPDVFVSSTAFELLSAVARARSA